MFLFGFVSTFDIVEGNGDIFGVHLHLVPELDPEDSSADRRHQTHKDCKKENYGEELLDQLQVLGGFRTAYILGMGPR
ncbi:hypothetical protein NL387_27420, partial [Klebsiella pneumoniae]|nr:hypothetical protein [Klebsiella pneumoniae]